MDKKFINSRKKSVKELGKFMSLGIDFMEKTASNFYCYNFDWLGIPIIQFPQDIVALQEVIWNTKPDLIIETGIGRGGSLIFYASILKLTVPNGLVVGIDIDIRKPNKEAIERHPLAKNIKLIEGSSTDNKVIDEIKKLSKKFKNIMVVLDSNHTSEHVFKELELYNNFVTKGCYCVVMDTVIDDMPEDFFPDRKWNKNNNPKTAVHKFLKINKRFLIDKDIQDKLLITSTTDGYLKCIK